MPNDLEGAFAKLQWADREIEKARDEIRTFLNKEPYKVIIDAETEPGIRLIKFDLQERIPALLNVSIGQILSAQRSSLDLLAVALAKRNRVQKLRSIYFPIAENSATLNGGQMRATFDGIGANAAQAIKALQPYKGGNDLLFALHSLNNHAKHRDLIAFARNPERFTMAGCGYVRRVTVWGSDNSTYPGQPYIRFDADPGVNLDLTSDVFFAEYEGILRSPAVEVLHDISRLVNTILTEIG
jgi:hypothetical protein